MRAKKASRYLCPTCTEPHDSYDGAVACCEPEEPEKVEGFVCGECDEWYEDREDAKECCK